MELAAGLMELSGFSLAAYLFYKTQNQQIKTLNLLEFVEKSTVFGPGLLEKVFSGRAPRYYLRSIRNFEEGDDYVRGLAFVQGIAHSDIPIYSALDNTTKLIFSSLTTESIFSNKKVINNSNDYANTSYVPSFELEDTKGFSTMKVVNNDAIKYGPSLELI